MWLLEKFLILLLGILVVFLHVGWEKGVAFQGVRMVTYLHLLTPTEEVLAAVLVSWHLVDLLEGVNLLLLLLCQDTLRYWGSHYGIAVRVNVVRYVCILFV